MELHRNTTEAFIDYLKKHNYPDNSIVLEWGNKYCSFDIAIMADDLVTPVALFEIKGRKTRETISRGIQQLKRATQMLDISVPCSLVFGTNKPPYFEVFEISDAIYNDVTINHEELLYEHTSSYPVSYENMIGGATTKVLTQKQEKKRKKIDKMKPICWFVLPIIALFFQLLDAIGVYELTTPRLIFLGAVVILILLPFFSEITLKDFSFKRKNK